MRFATRLSSVRTPTTSSSASVLPPVSARSPITLWPFPTKQIEELAKNKKGILVSEFNAGQMVEDVRLAVNGAIPVEHFGRLGGIVPSPEEIVDALKTKLVK